MSEPVQTSDATFAAEVLETKRPAVIDFWAEWCPPCQGIHGWMQNLAQNFSDRLVVAQVDVEKCPQLVAGFEVQAVPTILLMRDGKIVHRQCTELTESDLRALVEQHLLSHSGTQKYSQEETHVSSAA